MKKKRLLCMLLVLGMLLSGCSLSELETLVNHFRTGAVTPYSQMEYVRPNMDVLEQTLAESCAVLEKEKMPDQAFKAIEDFYRVYDRFYTSYNIANIRYSGDLTDIGWEAEYNFCAENVPLADAALDELYRAAAKSPARDKLEGAYFGEGFFESYEGEGLWNDEFLALMEEETRLTNAYYELADEALEYEQYSDAYFEQYSLPMTELFVVADALTLSTSVVTT